MISCLLFVSVSLSRSLFLSLYLSLSLSLALQQRHRAIYLLAFSLVLSPHIFPPFPPPKLFLGPPAGEFHAARMSDIHIYLDRLTISSATLWSLSTWASHSPTEELWDRPRVSFDSTSLSRSRRELRLDIRRPFYSQGKGKQTRTDMKALLPPFPRSRPPGLRVGSGSQNLLGAVLVVVEARHATVSGQNPPCKDGGDYWLRQTMTVKR